MLTGAPIILAMGAAAIMLVLLVIFRWFGAL